jgi:putative sterol carrier protein
MSIKEKLSDFIYKLYSKTVEDPVVIEAARGQELVLEMRIADCPEANFQIEVHEGKITVHKGTPKTPNAVVEYLKMKYLKDYWSGKMRSDTMFTSGAVALKAGSLADLMFLAPIEVPLRRAWKGLENEFPGLP